MITEIAAQFSRAFQQLQERIGGPLSFRLILQSSISLLLAIRAGWRDSQSGNPPFFWTFLSQKDQRKHLFKSCWADIKKLFIMAFAIDTLYQLLILKWFYPLQSLTVAIALAVLPYIIVRGPVTSVLNFFKRTHP